MDKDLADEHPKSRLIPVTSWRLAALSAQEIGGKAVGLLAAPRDATPDFIVLGRAFHEEWLRCGRSAAAVFREAGEPDLADLGELLERASAAEKSDGLIVRSNAPSEEFSEVRGRFESWDVGLGPGELLSAIDAVLAQGDLANEAVYAIVQTKINGTVSGHLSNERRVAERPERFLIEEEAGGATRQRWIAIREAEQLAVDDGQPPSLSAAIRRRAHELRRGSGGERLHCEWVWDGAVLWIVQRDTVRPQGNDPLAQYLSGRQDETGTPAPTRLRRIKQLTSAEAAQWSKLQRRHTLEELGLPVAPVYFLCGQDFPAAESAGEADLQTDLEAFIADGVPLVIRCDISTQTDRSSLSLPTSDPLLDSDRLLETMRDYQAHFRSSGLSDDQWAFLPASLVPARASVMVHARPSAQQIRLDALWGFPDGVGCLPHDSYFYTPALQQTVARRAYKGSCLLWSEQSGWTFEGVPQPHDWAPVLDREDEILTAARWAQQLADHLGTEVQLMVLARVGGARGPDHLLPWHYTDHEVPPTRNTVAAIPESKIATVQEPSDLEGLDTSPLEGLVLRPRVESRRDPEFINRVGEFAASAGLPVYFQGSVLGHSFYMLQAAGAQVVAVGPLPPENRSTELNKLVRDGIPEIVTRSGGRNRLVKADRAQAGWLLRQKLVEEALEIWNSDDAALIEELADLSEVLSAIFKHLDVDPEEVEAARLEKLQERGGFDELIFLQATAPDATVERVGADIEATLFDATVPADPLRVDDRQLEVEEDDSKVVFRIGLAPPLRNGIPLREETVRVGNADVRLRYVGNFAEVTVHSGEESAQLQLDL